MSTEFSLLRELAKLIEHHLSTRSSTIDGTAQDDLHSHIYRGLLNPSVTTESELHRSLPVARTKKYFAVLRDQVKHKLFNSLFTLELTSDSSSSYRRAAYRNAKTLFISQTLLMFGLGGSIQRTMRKGLKESAEYELTPNTIEFLRMLASQASFDGHETEVASLNLEIDRYLQILTLEIEGNRLWDELAAALAVTGAITERNQKLAHAASKRLADMYAKHPSFNIGRLYFRVRIMSLELEESLNEALTACGQAKQFLRSHPQFQSPSFAGEYAMKQLECSLHVGAYQTAKEAAADCSKLYTPGNPNWFNFKGPEFFLHLHLLDLKKAESIFNEVTTHPRYALLPEHLQQRWLLFKMYLEYAQGKFSEQSIVKQRLSALRRIPHSTAGYLKDKTGFNLSILILEFLLHFEGKQYGALEEKLETLNAYRQRYLKKDANSSRFIGFLGSVARYANDKKALRKSAVDYQKALGKDKSTTMIEGIQILPFRIISEQIGIRR
jgi:hypothetical protein